MRRKFVAGNWKMNGHFQFCEEFLSSIPKQNILENVEGIICPPFIFLQHLNKHIADSALSGLGAQNVCSLPNGAQTGEVSVSMLQEVGCQYIIVGHSERRQYYAETDLLISEKVKMILNTSIKPIICVGETLIERENHLTEDVITRQLTSILESVDVNQLESAVIAYEPVWAIGTGKTATPDDVQLIHQMLRSLIERFNKNVASKIRIIYGGSVNMLNAAKLFAEKDIDGGLIGGASLNPKEFLEILKIAGQESTC